LFILFPPLILAGAGVSMAMPAAQNAVLGAVAANEVGKASGIFNTSRFLGGTFGIALLVAVFAATGNVASTRAFSNGFAVVMAVSALLSLALALPARRVAATAQAKSAA
jgi:sugar phosphate permease